MTKPIDDLNYLSSLMSPYLGDVGTTEKANAALQRLRKFVEVNTPWCPPQQEGFGPWIEYKPGDPGPRVNDVVMWLANQERETRKWVRTETRASHIGWSGVVVAYCVKNKVES